MKWLLVVLVIVFVMLALVPIKPTGAFDSPLPFPPGPFKSPLGYTLWDRGLDNNQDVPVDAFVPMGASPEVPIGPEERLHCRRADRN